MYYARKTMEVAGSHRLSLPYESKCSNCHGHNWIITVHCKAEKLNDDGMVTDFAIIKKKVHGVLDHKCLNDVLPFNPTAENIAKWVCGQVPNCYRVDVQESSGNVATYED